MTYDLVIIGGGPAGLTAGLYAVRGGLKTILLEKGVPGGQAAQTDLIENYPGFPGGVSGLELMERFEKQGRAFGLEILNRTVESLTVESGYYRVIAGADCYQARAVIIATGTQFRELGIPGEKEFRGRGISYCATCDGAFFRERKVAVIGGGDAAVQEALFLTRFTGKVIVIHRREHLRAVNVLQKRAFDNPQIEFRLNTEVEAIEGDQTVRSLRLRDKQTGKTFSEDFGGVFIFIGSIPNTTFLNGTVALSKQGYIITDQSLQTSLRGVFAAGDVREKMARQVATAVGEGAQAAMTVEKYLSPYGEP